MAELPKYSILEIERRWLVDPAAVGDLTGVPFRFIEDLYVGDSRLRLRKITGADGNTLFKLGKKYGKHSHLSEPITTLYLTKNEYRQLAVLPGFPASKRRYALAGGSLDVYEKPASGLMLFEIEFQDEAAAALYRPPHFVTKEITGDAGFSGFALAKNV